MHSYAKFYKGVSGKSSNFASDFGKASNSFIVNINRKKKKKMASFINSTKTTNWILIGLIVVALAGAGYWYWKNHGEEAAPSGDPANE